VERVLVYNSSFTKTANGARIKTFSVWNSFLNPLTLVGGVIDEIENDMLLKCSYEKNKQ